MGGQTGEVVDTLIPVRSDGRTCSHSGRELERTGCAIIIASKLRVGGIGDWIAREYFQQVRVVV
jgi:hypothetical protein